MYKKYKRDRHNPGGSGADLITNDCISGNTIAAVNKKYIFPNSQNAITLVYTIWSDAGINQENFTDKSCRYGSRAPINSDEREV
jgi:hypothetical protein